MFFNVSNDLDDRTLIKVQHMHVTCLKDDKTAETPVWCLMDLSKLYICICTLLISGFAGLAILHLSYAFADR